MAFTKTKTPRRGVFVRRKLSFLLCSLLGSFLCYFLDYLFLFYGHDFFSLIVLDLSILSNKSININSRPHYLFITFSFTRYTHVLCVCL